MLKLPERIEDDFVIFAKRHQLMCWDFAEISSDLVRAS